MSTAAAWVVLCKADEAQRLVGPFESQAAADNWAREMQRHNRHWTYSATLMSPPS